MQHGISVIAGTSVINAGSSVLVKSNIGFQGVIVCDGTIFPSELQLLLKLPGGGDGVVNSSKFISAKGVYGPLYFPPGQYCVKSVASSAINIWVSILPAL